MSDLISRSKVISVLEQLEEHSLSGKMDISNAIYLLENQPTAYDIDKVVEELENWSFETKILVPNSNELGEYEEEVERKIICTQNAIEIVKQGGVGKDVE